MTTKKLIILVMGFLLCISCSREAEQIENEVTFDANFVLKNKTKFEILFTHQIVPSQQINTKNVVDFERLELLINLESPSSAEVNELSLLLESLGFSSIEEYIEYQLALNDLGEFLVISTNIEDLSPEERNAVILEVYTEFDILFTKNCQGAYDACENGVSGALAIDLLNCAVAAGVAGLGTGGVGGLIVGVA